MRESGIRRTVEGTLIWHQKPQQPPISAETLERLERAVARVGELTGGANIEVRVELPPTPPWWQESVVPSPFPGRVARLRKQLDGEQHLAKRKAGMVRRGEALLEKPTPQESADVAWDRWESDLPEIPAPRRPKDVRTWTDAAEAIAVLVAALSTAEAQAVEHQPALQDTVPSTVATEVDPPDTDTGPATEQPCKSWQEVAERLERLRAQGDPWTSCEKMADQLGCSASTIHKAMQRTASLQSWAKPSGAAPKAKRLDQQTRDGEWFSEVANNTPQKRDPSPEDAASINEFLEKADERSRVWFQSLSFEDQLEYLEGLPDEPKVYPKP
jgi:hypothetical protein